MFLRIVDDPEVFWHYIQAGMLHLPRTYNPNECPLLTRALERLHKKQSRVILVVGQTHAHHVGQLACPNVHLAVHWWHMSRDTIVIDFVMMSIPCKQKNVRPWVVINEFRNWFRIQQRHGLRVLVGFQPEMEGSTALELLRKTALGQLCSQIVEGQYLTLYSLTDQWLDALIMIMIKASGLSEMEQRRELALHTPSSRHHQLPPARR